MSWYSGSPGAPGSFVRSSTAIARTVGGSAPANASPENGRKSRTFTTPTFSPPATERVHGLLHGAGARAHQHHDPLGVGRPVVVEQVVRTAGESREPVHRPLHDLRDDRVEGVRGLAGLEEHVGVLGGTAEHRVVRGQGPIAMRPDEVVVDELAQHLVRQRTDHVHLVRGPEAVEEVQERHAALERRRVRDRGQVLGRLHVRGRQHRPAGRPDGHHVALVPEDRQRVRRERPRGDVDHGRRELAGDLVHVRDHQQQTLRRGERRAQRAGLERTVQRAGRAALALHLDHLRDRAPQVRPCRRPTRRPRARPSARTA